MTISSRSGTAVAGRLGRDGAFWAAASVLALALWSSGAPSVLYPIYAERWDLTPVVMTTVFATYQLALMVVLPLFGNLSDLVGRRRVMTLGVGLMAVSALLFAVAPDVSYLYAGRVLQERGRPVDGAATASLVENSTTRGPRAASTTATVATSAGLTLALLVSGVLAEYLPMPLLWSYVVLLVLATASVVALALTRTTGPGACALAAARPSCPPGSAPASSSRPCPSRWRTASGRSSCPWALT
ncbi:MFS transporter [Janibacter melonis]|uniref:MFS transporter n=1 Tax=Janibacter melonis TaxID=262209 RepID=UPI0020956DD5|nr:MFS transporter [Janibacter melonis]